MIQEIRDVRPEPGKIVLDVVAAHTPVDEDLLLELEDGEIRPVRIQQAPGTTRSHEIPHPGGSPGVKEIRAPQSGIVMQFKEPIGSDRCPNCRQTKSDCRCTKPR